MCMKKLISNGAGSERIPNPKRSRNFFIGSSVRSAAASPNRFEYGKYLLFQVIIVNANIF